MKIAKSLTILLTILAIIGWSSSSQLEAVTYVTDTGGYAWDESRAAVNLAPAIALSTVALAAIIAVAVQNTHDHSSSSSSHCHCCCFSSCTSSNVHASGCCP